MNPKKIWRIIILIVLSLFLVFFYDFMQEKQANKQAYVIYIPKIIDVENDFWTTLSSGAQAAAREYNIRLVIEGPSSETDYMTQNALILEAIEKKPDVLAISPINTKNSQEVIQQAIDAKIKVIYIDSVVEDTRSNSVIATNNYEAGGKMGQYLLSLMDKDSVVGIISFVKESSTAIEREAGVRDALGNEQMNIIETVYCDSDFEKAYQVTRDLLKKHPQITLLAGLNEYAAVGAGNAICDLGLSGKVKIVGFDNSIASVQFLESGVFEGLIIQNSFNMGYLGIESANQLFQNQMVPSFIDSGCALISRDTMYTDEGQKLLFSFLDID